ncbi:hypothetical protein cyc_04168 [Cyclospora cayetanensis]|uniref:Uncharacterized protein n=1 Tax=Cyclospora cayetanensis TaxID=88456 RepID=A0A1D3D591_9EIME|nr:hypothetical protein cyc_04168 [Cyclospora cayetanensis]
MDDIVEPSANVCAVSVPETLFRLMWCHTNDEGYIAIAYMQTPSSNHMWRLLAHPTQTRIAECWMSVLDLLTRRHK